MSSLESRTFIRDWGQEFQKNVNKNNKSKLLDCVASSLATQPQMNNVLESYYMMFEVSIRVEKVINKNYFVF